MGGSKWGSEFRGKEFPEWEKHPLNEEVRTEDGEGWGWKSGGRDVELEGTETRRDGLGG